MSTCHLNYIHKMAKANGDIQYTDIPYIVCQTITFPHQKQHVFWNICHHLHFKHIVFNVPLYCRSDCVLFSVRGKNLPKIQMENTCMKRECCHPKANKLNIACANNISIMWVKILYYHALIFEWRTIDLPILGIILFFVDVLNLQYMLVYFLKSMMIGKYILISWIVLHCEINKSMVGYCLL